MRCYYTYVKDFGKVLIPGCIGVSVHNDIDYCTCKSNSDYNFEKKEYNRILQEKEEYIKILEKEIANLHLIIESKNNNENYLQSKIELAKNTWKDIDVDEYLKQVRGE